MNGPTKGTWETAHERGAGLRRLASYVPQEQFPMVILASWLNHSLIPFLNKWKCYFWVENRSVAGWKRGVKVWKRLGTLWEAPISTLKQFSLVLFAILNELKLDFFFFGPKWECFDHQHYIVRQPFDLIIIHLQFQTFVLTVLCASDVKRGGGTYHFEDCRFSHYFSFRL